MASSGNILRIGTEMDVAPLIAGSNQAAAAIEKIGAATKSTAADTNELARAGQFVETQNRRSLAQFNDHAAALTKEGYSLREARGAARLLADELGVHLNRELANTLARSELIGPLLEKAFSVFAIIGFIQILGEVPDAIEKIIGKLTGWDEAAQKAYLEQVRLNIAAIDSNVHLGAEIDAVNTIGLEGSKKYEAQLRNVEAQLKRTGLASGGLSRGTQDIKAQMDRLKPPIQATSTLGSIAEWTERNIILLEGVRNALNGTNKEWDNLNEQKKMGEEETRKLTDEENRLRLVEKGRIDAEEAAEKRKQGLEDEQARVDRIAKFSATIEGYDQSVYQNRLKLSEITLAQETDLMRDSMNREFAAEEDRYNKTRRLKLAEAATGKDVTTEIEALDGEMEAKRTEHFRKLNDLETNYQAQSRARTLAARDAAIDAEEKIEEAETKRQEAAARFAFQKADNPKEVEAAAVPLIKETTAAYDVQIAAIERRKAALSAAGPLSPDNLDKLKALDAQERALRIDQAAAVEAIERDKGEKLKKLSADDVQDQIDAIERQGRQQQDAYAEQARAIDTSLDEKRVSLHQWYGEETALNEAEYANQLETLNKEAEIRRKEAADGIITEKELSRELESIWKQQEAAHEALMKKDEEAFRKVQLEEQKEAQKAFSAISTSLNGALNSWISGHERLGTALAKAWDEIVIKAADSIAKIGENFLLGLLLQQSAQEKQVLMDAKKAAADAYAWAGNPIAGAILAAATFAAVVAAYTPSFAQGGIVKANLHEGEMVLPPHISQFVQVAANNFAGIPQGAARGGDTNRSTVNRINVTVNNHGGEVDHDAIIASVKAGVRRGELGL